MRSSMGTTPIGVWGFLITLTLCLNTAAEVFNPVPLPEGPGFSVNLPEQLVGHCAEMDGFGDYFEDKTRIKFKCTYEIAGSEDLDRFYEGLLGAHRYRFPYAAAYIDFPIADHRNSYGYGIHVGLSMPPGDLVAHDGRYYRKLNAVVFNLEMSCLKKVTPVSCVREAFLQDARRMGGTKGVVTGFIDLDGPQSQPGPGGDLSEFCRQNPQACTGGG